MKIKVPVLMVRGAEKSRPRKWVYTDEFTRYSNFVFMIKPYFEFPLLICTARSSFNLAVLVY